MTIRLLCDPCPQAQESQFVKDAYAGLVLTVRETFPPTGKLFPNGAYDVSLAEIMTEMASHNPRAYFFMKAAWGDLPNILKGMGRSIGIPIPLECCEVVH